MTSNITPYPKSFFDQPTVEVARALLGSRLVFRNPLGEVAGVISETEAYVGETDLACHAKAGKTKRTAVMYGEPGYAYVYFTYGHHWMLNVVTERFGFPAAVLIPGVRIQVGQAIVAENRACVHEKNWSNGPGKLTKAYGITNQQNGIDLTDKNSGLWIEPYKNIPDSTVTIGPRVGLYSVPEPWYSKPWRFLIPEKTNLEE